MSGQIPNTMFGDFKVLQHNIFTQKSSKFCKKQGKLSKLYRKKSKKKSTQKSFKSIYISSSVQGYKTSKVELEINSCNFVGTLYFLT